MNEIQRNNYNQLVRKKLEETLSLNTVQAHTFSANFSELRDHEVFLRQNYVIRFNAVKAEYELLKVFEDEEGGRSIEVWEVLSRDELMNDLIRAKFKISDADFDRTLADRRLVPAYNPFINYFNGLVFNGEKGSAIDHFSSFVTVEGGETEQERWKVNFKKALVRTVKCALNDNYFNKQCLVLYSADQSVGKTSYLRTLCPPALSDYFFEEMIGSDKDSQIMLANNFIILLDELATLSRVDINHLKAILSKREVNVRLPYARKSQIFPRRSSFFGTTNRTDFLLDNQNVRWVVFAVEDIDKSYGNIFTGEYNIDINNIWAEAFQLYKDGFMCELTKEDLELNENNNRMYSASSVEKELIEKYLEPAEFSDKDKKGYKRGQPTDVFITISNILKEEGLEDMIKLNQVKFFLELKQIAGWKKVSVQLEDGRIVAGYHYFVRSEKVNDELF
jgi:hypothetical protein